MSRTTSFRVRITVLESAAAEYRRQMTVVLTSASWRLSAPLRGLAGKFRLARRRVRAIPRRLTSPGRRTVSPTTGLFAPTRRGTTAGSPHPSPLLDLPLEHGARSLRPTPQPATRQARLLVVAHVFYPEVWSDIEDRLARMPEDYDLIVTLVKGPAESLEGHISTRLPRARIHLVENVGRDSWPLVDLARVGAFEGYDAVLKVHTKRSVHRVDGDAWRLELLDGLLPSPEGIRRIVDLIRRDKDVGLVAPTGHLKGAETWGSDQELVEALAARIPFAFDPDGLRYPAGSMYWARPWLLQRLADLELAVRALRVRGRPPRRLHRARDRAVRRRAGDRVRARAGRDRRGALAAPPGTQVDHADHTPGAGLLPPAVPPDPRERRLVGQGLHRVDERRPPPGRVYRGHAPAQLPASSASTTSGSKVMRQPDRDGRRRTASTASCTTTTGSPASACSNLPIERLSATRSVDPVLHHVGERELDPALGRPRLSDVLIGQDYDRVPARPSSTTSCRVPHGPALHPGRRQAAPRRLPHRPAPRRCSDHRHVATSGPTRTVSAGSMSWR